MKFLVLLVLSMTTGYEVSFGMKACHQGWFKFTCKYPEINKSYQDNDIVDFNETTIQSSENDVWETEGRLYHDTKSKNHQAAVKDLKQKCKLNRSSNLTDRKDEKPEPELESCRRTLNLILYKKTCDFPGDDYMSGFTFFCRKNNFTCEDILLTNYPQKSKGLFILTSHGFSASISHVSRWDTGVYWCAVLSNDGRFSLKRVKINLLSPTPLSAIKKSAAVGQTVTYWCGYNQDIASLKKMFCKGDDPSICKPLINTRETHINRFSMNHTKNKITITMREITLNDSGTYWCGAESTDNQTSNVFFGRLFLTVDGPSNTAPAPASQSHGIVVIVCVALMLLLMLVFVIVLILIYKRISKLQNTGNEAAVQTIKEENIYEEFQEQLQYPDSETATSTVYLTVTPPNQPDSLHYSTINFQSRSNKAGGETPTVKPSSSAYKYSAVAFSKRPTNSSVNQLYRPTEESLYSRVKRTGKNENRN
ncbi:uncharacterized protein LOC109202271 [Oreochromis niloticus]|uniref:uncharacterized protein LOC109202271 n=1 Tax=Oreochromis niloticus TaxID=8128 RepID=UPI0009057336|nr:uncharacterized protein LOC109202271 [Oreochromis niloticus]